MSTECARGVSGGGGGRACSRLIFTRSLYGITVMLPSISFLVYGGREAGKIGILSPIIVRVRLSYCVAL